MAYTTIDDPSAHHQTAFYTGNATQRNITNDGNSDLQPDWVWIKSVSALESNMLYDTSRGVTKDLRSGGTAAENTNAQGLQAFNSDGFQLGTLQNVNYNSQTLVAWQWKANGGTLTTNDASATSIGTHDSQFQANTTAGFSIVTWTGNAEPETIAHGLGATPDMIWIKNRADSEGWWVGSASAGSISGGKYLLLHNDNALATNSTSFVNQDPTSTVFRVGGSNSGADNLINGNSDNMIAYCFTSIKGYSKIGSYTGNGNADGTFVYTGFKPAWLLWKRTDSATSWRVFDNKRDTDNVVKSRLFPDVTDAANTSQDTLDFLSNGFKLKSTNSGGNASSGTYIYMAFAEHPFVSSKGVPVTAR